MNETYLKEIKKIFELSEYNVEKNYFAKREDAAIKYLEEAKEEIDEAILECRDKNAIYLEDELGDIFWDYLASIKVLEKEGKIRSIENVFKNCFRKYSERLEILELEKYKEWHNNPKKDEVPKEWKKIKNKQKKSLKEKHEKLYKG